MPSGRTKKTKTPSKVPDAGNPDRKRVLNVLAQRRYRRRRREKVATLEAQVKDNPTLSKEQLRSNEIETSITSNSEEGDVVEEVNRNYNYESLNLLDFEQDQFDTLLLHEFNPFADLPSPIPTYPSPSPLQLPFSSDGAILSIPILSAIRAFASVAVALDVTIHLWDPFYLHILPDSIPALAALPSNLHPVPAQLTIPHHPVLDLLPWPSMRERLICMLSMPSAFRPLIAQEDDQACAAFPTSGSDKTSTGIKQSGAIVQLVQDLDDFQDGGGMRVHGNTTTWSEGNELLEESWEIGDLFYQNWWWCLDQRIVDVSNRRRRERGLGRLRIVSN